MSKSKRIKGSKEKSLVESVKDVETGLKKSYLASILHKITGWVYDLKTYPYGLFARRIIRNIFFRIFLFCVFIIFSITSVVSPYNSARAFKEIMNDKVMDV